MLAGLVRRVSAASIPLLSRAAGAVDKLTTGCRGGWWWTFGLVAFAGGRSFLLAAETQFDFYYQRPWRKKYFSMPRLFIDSKHEERRSLRKTYERFVPLEMLKVPTTWC